MMMKKVMLVILFLTQGVAVTADKPKVMLFGTFHFENPGLDVVKMNVINVMTDENQQYLQDFSEKVAREFKPTKVLIECSRKIQAKISDRYKNYLAGKYQLPANETYQIGFRLAKLANIKHLICYDENEIHWNAQGLMENMPKLSPDTEKKAAALMEKMGKEATHMHATKSLKEVLQFNNTKSEDDNNKYLYIMTNHVGAGDQFYGADASASWWHRNFRMYANIQAAATEGERVFVIGGQGHTAILRDFLAVDLDRQAVDVMPLL